MDSIEKICSICKKKFNSDDAEFELGEKYPKIAYSGFIEDFPLCGECAIAAVKEKKRGLCYEKCSICNTEFDVIEENEKYRECKDTDEEFPLVDIDNAKIYCFNCKLSGIVKQLDKRQKGNE